MYMDIFTVQNQSTFLGAIATSLSTMLVIIFSISLIAIQHASEKYTPRVLNYYVKNKRISFVFIIFIVGILFSIFSIGYPLKYSQEISFIFLIVSLLLAYYNFIKVSEFINPLKLLDQLTEEVIKNAKKVENKGRDFFQNYIKGPISDISSICLKSDENIGDTCINKLKYIAKNVNFERDKHFVVAELKEIGKKCARTQTKQKLAVEAIISLLELAKENLQIIKEKSGRLYLISDPIIWSREIFKEIVLSRNLNEIDSIDIRWIYSSIYLYVEEAIKDLNLELEAKERYIYDALDLFDFIFEESINIPKLEKKYFDIISLYKEYTNRLHSITFDKKLPKIIKNKVFEMKKKSESIKI